MSRSLVTHSRTTGSASLPSPEASETQSATCSLHAASRTTSNVDLIAGLGGIVHTDRSGAAEVLAAHGVRFGLENHPERTPAEVLAAIGDESSLGAAVDTGWWATQGYDPVDAIRELSDRLFHVHLKDVEKPGTHVSCMHGEGCARITDCVDALVELGYSGALTVEHEPYDRDPTAECARMLTLLREQLERAGTGHHV